MKKLDRLKREAMESAEGFRGHDMTPWQTIVKGKSAYAACMACHAEVIVDSNPMPNGIEIHGDAVALNCS